MKFSSREQIENLAGFQSENFLITSFYLDTDKSRLTKKEIQLSLKNLISTGKRWLEEMEIGKSQKDSLSVDLEKIHQFCSQHLSSYNFPGLAIFSCSGQEFWQLFSLPSAPRNRVIFDKNPYVRFLSAILDEHSRIFVVTLGRRDAKMYRILMGEISLIDSLAEDVPKKVREAGWEGYEEKRIERHIETHLRAFFKKTAQRAFEFLKKNHFDRVFLGVNEEYWSDFERLLHPYLKSRFKGLLKATPADSSSRVLEEVLELEKNLKKKEEDEIVNKFVSLLEKGGLAVSGIKSTLQSLNRNEVQTLIVIRYFSKPGRICPRCRFLFVDELKCPSCQRKTEKAVDVIDEAVEAALTKSGEVKHIHPPSRLSRYGNIGAFLRFKT